VRTYLALVHGVPEPDHGLIDLAIGPPAPGRIARRVDSAGVPARTRYRVAGVHGDLSLVELVLETGRTHQIRVHMAAIGHPVAGDFLYGTEEPGLIGRQALHCAALSFRHPMTDRALSFTAPLPPDMARLAGCVAPEGRL
jgi:23S rRNA pseudouridine1911/1915/1917 synthase